MSPSSPESAAAFAPVPLVPRPFGLRVAKRLMDLAVAVPAFVATAPVVAGAAALVKLTSPGPAFYQWRVVGKGGRPMISHKIRTMVQDADKLKAELLRQNEMTGPMFKMASDPRVTRVGRVLRRYSIDELPQLWSVIKGDMSVVGPRPPLQTEWREFPPQFRRKRSVKPGLTCLWQVSGRNDIRDFEEWMRLDLHYVDHWSLRLDLEILARTALTVVRGTGK